MLVKLLDLKGAIKPFGSYTSGLITRASDLDVMYERSDDERDLSSVVILQKFLEKLPVYGFKNFVKVRKSWEFRFKNFVKVRKSWEFS
jgi:DNA polymerase sigma